MVRAWTAWVPGLWMLVGCQLVVGGVDSDGDGLTDAEEAELGTDPRLVDTDGDGLTDTEERAQGFDPLDRDMDDDGVLDGEERLLGTDPRRADSDGDGLSDGDEVERGTDPLSSDTDEDGLSDGEELALGSDPTDPESDGTYTGGWPRQTASVKDALEADGATGASIAVTRRFPRLVAVDQHGQAVDLYDFAGHGRSVVLDVSAQWCPPCKALAEYFDDGEDVLGDGGAMRQRVASGEVFWVTVLAEDDDGGAPDDATSSAWARDFSSDHAVLADEDQELVDYVLGETNAWPSLVVLDEDMRVVDFGAGIDPDVLGSVD